MRRVAKICVLPARRASGAKGVYGESVAGEPKCQAQLKDLNQCDRYGCEQIDGRWFCKQHAKLARAHGTEVTDG